MMQTYDIYLVGVGGQGVLTIADLITRTAFRKGIPVNYYPTKGMAQRGGFVKVRLRLGSSEVGPDISEGGADLVISMERSESLKAVRFLKTGGEFLLYDHRWNPAAVMLGKAPYPDLATVWDEIAAVGGKVYALSDKDLPAYEGRPVRDNIYVLGSVLAQTKITDILPLKDMEETIAARWPKVTAVNAFTLEAGEKAPLLAHP